MTIAEIGAIGEFIGAIAVVVTLVYLAIQMRQNTNALKLNAVRSVTEELQDMFSLAASSLELSEIIVKAAAHGELQGSERARYYMFTNNLVRVYENAFFLSRAGVVDRTHWEGMTRMMIDYTSMAGFQKFWEDRKHWVSGDFQEYMDREVVPVPPKTGVPVPGGY